jgi:hypothetical protein
MTMPRIGRELGRGSEGIVYENLDRPGWVVKEYYQGRTSPLQAANEFQNLENARAISPENVVQAEAPTNPRQDFLVKQQVLETTVPEDFAQRAQVEQVFQNIPDAAGNLLWGTTLDNPTPRWLLIE